MTCSNVLVVKMPSHAYTTIWQMHFIPCLTNAHIALLFWHMHFLFFFCLTFALEQLGPLSDKCP